MCCMDWFMHARAFVTMLSDKTYIVWLCSVIAVFHLCSIQYTMHKHGNLTYKLLIYSVNSVLCVQIRRNIYFFL